VRRAEERVNAGIVICKREQGMTMAVITRSSQASDDDVSQTDIEVDQHYGPDFISKMVCGVHEYEIIYK